MISDCKELFTFVSNRLLSASEILGLYHSWNGTESAFKDFKPKVGRKQTEGTFENVM